MKIRKIRGHENQVLEKPTALLKPCLLPYVSWERLQAPVTMKWKEMDE